MFHQFCQQSSAQPNISLAHSQNERPYIHQPHKTRTMETVTKITASAARSTANAIEDPFRLRKIVTIDTSYILQDKSRFYIIAALTLWWLSTQVRRYTARDLNAGCWYGWDALGMAAVAFFCGRKQLALACIFTPAYFIWTRLPGSLFNDLHLPSFSTFLETTSGQHTNDVAIQGPDDTANVPEDAPACLVCWSSDMRPIALPCNHFMCQECLTTMRTRRQTCCPLCHHPLFHDNSGLRCATHKAVVATLAARLTATGIQHVLQLWHGQYWDVAKSAATDLPQLYCFQALRIVVQTQGVEWWQFGMFDYLMPLPVPDARFWKSVWPPVVFTLLFSVNVYGVLRDIEKLDLMVDRVVHQELFAGLYAS
jgi:hypothetical protein